MSRELWPEPDDCIDPSEFERDAWLDEQDSIGDEMVAREQIDEEELRDR